MAGGGDARAGWRGTAAGAGDSIAGAGDFMGASSGADTGENGAGCDVKEGLGAAELLLMVAGCVGLRTLPENVVLLNTDNVPSEPANWVMRYIDKNRRRKSTRLNSSHVRTSRMPSSA